MAGVAKVSVALTPELHDLVQEAVSAGDYASTSEVVREALRDWKERRERKRIAVRELRRLWSEGIASGPGELLDIDAIKREGRRRLSAEKKKRARG
jgi:antitoxin ParD1/3/4